MGRKIIGWAAVTLLFAVGSTWADEKGKAKPIPADEAKDHVGETITVAMTVKHAKDATHEESVFLDSEADYKDPKNLAVTIPYKYVPLFKHAGNADLVSRYEGRAIRVTGKVVREKDQIRIRVTDPKQIETGTAQGP